jgi:hypothetical protein
MPIQLLDTTITGLGAGGLPSGVVTSSTMSSSGRFYSAHTARTSTQTLNGDSGWQDHLSLSFTAGVSCRAMFWFLPSITYELNEVQGFFRFVLDGSMIGYNWCSGKQSSSNNGQAGFGHWYADVSAGSHTILIQARNLLSGTWITNYWTADGEAGNTLGVIYYA